MSTTIGQVTAPVPAGWYPDAEGNQRWWDGQHWTEHVVQTPHPVSATQNSHGPMTSASMNVNRQVYYNRQQKGHSVIAHTILAVLTAGISLIWTIYFAVSPNHFFHA